MKPIARGFSTSILWCSRQPRTMISTGLTGWFRIGIHCLPLIFLSACVDRQDLPAPPQDIDQKVEVMPAPPIPGADDQVPRPIKAHPKFKKPVVPREARKISPDDGAIGIEPSTLIGKEPSAVADLLGSPASISRSDVSVVWTYNYSGCAFQLYFYPDLKTSVFHAWQYVGPSNSGESTESSPICGRHLLMAKSNGTN